MAVLLIGTLDTKGVEFAVVRDLLREAGVEVLVLDAGVLRPPAFAPDVPRERVFAAAGESLDALRKAGDRGRAVEAAAHGAAVVARDLHRQGRVDAVLGLGGSAGTAIGTAAMRTLPFGVPKLMVSTMASGQVRPYVGQSDVCMMYSVVDVSGLNRDQSARPGQRGGGRRRHGARDEDARGRRRGPAADRGHDVRRDDAVRGRRPRPGGAGRLRNAGLSRHRHGRPDDGDRSSPRAKSPASST